MIHVLLYLGNVAFFSLNFTFYLGSFILRYPTVEWATLCCQVLSVDISILHCNFLFLLGCLPCWDLRAFSIRLLQLVFAVCNVIMIIVIIGSLVYLGNR